MPKNDHKVLEGKYLECLCTEESRPQWRDLSMAMESLRWFFPVQPVISRGRIWPVEVKNLERISGMVYKSKGSMPALSNGSVEPFSLCALRLSLLSMSSLSLEKSNGSYESPAENLLVKDGSTCVGGCVLSWKFLANPITWFMTESLSLVSCPVQEPLLFISGVEGKPLLRFLGVKLMNRTKHSPLVNNLLLYIVTCGLLKW